jgi:6-phosphogluconolactonase
MLRSPALFLALGLGCFPMTNLDAATFRVYFGTYTGKDSQGIYQATFDSETGKLSPAELAGEATNPSFLAIHPSKKYLFAVGEIADFEGKKTGGVSAFAVDAATGKLTLLNQQSSQGTGPCHITVDTAGKTALIANYGGGSIASLPIAADGKLQPAASAIQHVGKSVTKRQDAPHAHSINLDPLNEFAFTADLGLDQVLVYRFDATTSKLTPHDPPFGAVPGGSGPRHFTFHPSGKFAYVINELANTVTAFVFDRRAGKLTPTQNISTLPEGFDGTSYTAEVVMHPSGKFLYGSNRGHDSLAVFKVDQTTGRLAPVDFVPTGGKTPRNFNVDPTGQWVLAANQGTGTVTVFRVDPQTGNLSPTGQTEPVPAPVCIRFVARD